MFAALLRYSFVHEMLARRCAVLWLAYCPMPMPAHAVRCAQVMKRGKNRPGPADYDPLEVREY